MTTTLLSDQQLQDRKYRIGSSEVPIIMGTKPGLAQLWLEKSGRAERNFTGNRYTEWGNRLEGAVAEAYAEIMRAPTEDARKSLPNARIQRL